MSPARPSPLIRTDATIALAVGLVLTVGWSATGWESLSALRLPDTDDVMRLAQIRDWLGGQGFFDLTQYRLGPYGLAMHWSRLPDLVPAALIGGLTPLLGAHAATVAAVIAWPAMLFVGYLFLSARIARMLSGGSEPPVAIVVAALAYPAISLFIPGRIDHHGLQMLLLLAVVAGLVDGPSIRSGAVAGLASALSMIVGLETAPAIVAAMAALLILWTLGGRPEAARTVGYGGGLLVALAAGMLLFRPQVFPADRCDSFTPGVAYALGIAGLIWVALGALTPALADWRRQLAAGVLLGAAGLGLVFLFAPACLASPYGQIDPLLAQIWLANVGEAGGVVAQHPGTLIAYLGLPIVAFFATGVFLRREPEHRAGWGVLLIVQAASLGVALFQLRGAYVAASLAAPALAHMIIRARGRGLPMLAGAWLLSAGLLWQQIGAAVGSEASPQAAPAGRARAGCTDPETIAQIARLPAGMVMAPIDLGAFVIGMTEHRAMAAPYHRNNRGNRAMYDFFLASPDAARFQAGLWSVDYVAICPDSFGEVPTAMIRPTSLARQLQAGVVPAWLSPVLMIDSEARLYRVLPAAGAGR